MSTFNLVSAQATAANNIITLLTEARLLGQYKHTKLNATREAITVVLSKCYAELNRVEKVTGKNMYNVWMAVAEMRGRSNWADHNSMMDTLEAALKGFIAEYMNEAATTATTETTEVIEMGTIYVTQDGTQLMAAQQESWMPVGVWRLAPEGWVMITAYSPSLLQHWLSKGIITKLK